MTASGLKFYERMMRLSRRVAPIRCRGRRRVPDHERPAGPRLVVGRGRRFRRVRRTRARDIVEIVFWTLVVYGCWMAWNYGVWGWF